MLLATNAVLGSSIENVGQQERVGTLDNFLFDDQQWTVRYLRIDTGGWLPGRQVILAPRVIDRNEWSNRRLWTGLTRQQVKDSPPIEADRPVSRQKEIELANYYLWGVYWAADQQPPEVEGDPTLRSAREVTGYRIQAADGEIGHVEDLILDDEGLAPGLWVFRYLVVDTRNWLPGRKVLVAPLWADQISFDEQKVHIGLRREEIEQSPEYDPRVPINREYEEILFDFYGKPKYWVPHENAPSG